MNRCVFFCYSKIFKKNSGFIKQLNYVATNDNDEDDQCLQESEWKDFFLRVLRCLSSSSTYSMYVIFFFWSENWMNEFLFSHKPWIFNCSSFFLNIYLMNLMILHRYHCCRCCFRRLRRGCCYRKLSKIQHWHWSFSF